MNTSRKNKHSISPLVGNSYLRLTIVLTLSLVLAGVASWLTLSAKGRALAYSAHNRLMFPPPPAATLYVDDTLVITNDVAPPGLSAGDTVTFASGEPGQTTGLTFDTDAFSTIASAIAAAATPGSTINVAAGTYIQASGINLNKSIILQGPNAAISPNGGVRVAEAIITGAVNPILRISSPGSPVTIEGFTFDTTGVVDAYDPALDITIRKNIYSNGTSNGAFYFLNNPTQLTLDDNRLTNPVLADNDTIFVAGNWNGTTGTVASITNNVIENTPADSTSGMNLSNVSGTISGNRFMTLRYYAILLANNSSSMTISNNLFDGIVNPNPAGVPSWGAGVRTFTPSYTGPVNITGNTFQNCYTGVGIRGVPNDNGASIVGMDINVNFNRFINNNFGITDGAAGTLDAENNWWGCNFGPGTGGAGCAGTPNGLNTTGTAIIDADPWLTLTFAAAPTTVPAGTNSTLTAKLVINSAGTDTSSMSLFVPDTTPVNFATGSGSVAPMSTTTTNGVATSTLTAGGTLGANGAAANVDGQIVSQALTIVEGPPAALAYVQQPTDALPNFTITPAVTVQLKDAFGNNSPASGVSIILSLSSGTGTLSGTLTQMTDASGLATFNNLSIDQPGSKQLTAASGALTSAVSNSFTIAGIPTIVYVDDNWVGTAMGADPDGGGPATVFGYDAFATVQGGINGVASGGQVIVYAGTYIENPNVNKPVTLTGANAGTSGSATRAPESLIRTNGNQPTVVSVTTSNVNINGFLIEGDDPGLTNVMLKSGNDANAAHGITNAVVSGSVLAEISSLTVQNNVIRNVSIGVRIQRNSGGASSGHLVTNNLFDSIGNFDFGYAVNLRNCSYADITNNKMTRVWTGLHTSGSFNLAGPPTWTMSGNEIHSYASGVDYLLQFGAVTPLTLDNNQISAETGAVANNFGVLMVSVQDTVSPTITNNTITGTDYGVGLTNTSTSNVVTLGVTNTITGTKLAGVLLTDNLNFNPFGTTLLTSDAFTGPTHAIAVNLNGVSISADTGVGVKVETSRTMAADVTTTVNIQGGASISGGSTGLLMTGAMTALTGNALNNTAFSGQSGDYVTLANSALDNLEINATAVTFDGLTGAMATAAQNLAIEGKLTHAPDNSLLGLLRIKTGSVFVAPPNSLQAGIDTAQPGETVNVAAGTYTGNVILNKSLTLLGAQAGVNACGRSATETILTAASGTVLTLQTGSAGSIINGFTISGGARGIESSSGPLNNLQILNNRVIAFTNNGIFLNDSGVDITVDQNSIDGGSKTASGGLFHLDTDSFNGFHFTSNCVTGKGASDTSTGFFVDGNHNVGASATPRNPMISGNTITACQTGMNLGTRAFGSLTVPDTGTISNNTFSNNLFDGLQGGIQNTAITGNTFSGNGRHGLALTSFGNTGTDRGGQNTTVKGNLITGNGFNASPNNGAGLSFSATQAAGTISTNHANFNRIAGNAVGASYSGAEVIDIENNWWGCNFGPGTGGAGCSGTPNALSGTAPPTPSASTLDANPWLTLTLMAMPSTVAQFGNSTLASKLTINSDGVDTAPMSMFVPNGTPVSFGQGTLGSVAPTSAMTTNGLANATYTAGVVPGGDSVPTTIDGQTVSTGITIGCVLITIAPASLGAGTAGLPYPNTQLTATGGVGPHAFSILSGALPSGMTLSPAGLISGTPLQVGAFNFVVQATDQGGCIGTQTYSLVIICPAITLSPASLPNAAINTAYPQTITASPAGGSYTFAVTSGLLPAGLALNSNGSFSGAPTQSGTFNFRITATGFGSCTGFRDYTLVVDCPSITVNPSSLPGGTVGTVYNQTVSASPAGTYSFSVSSGALPTGLTLNAASGAITGTPTTTGSFSFTISATAGSCSGSRSYTVAITCGTIAFTTTSPLNSGQAGVFYSQTLNVTPAGSYTFSLVTGNLPAGLTLHPTFGVISGTPATTGTSIFTVKAQGANSCSATQTYTLVIGCPAITVNPATLLSGTIGTAYAQTVAASPAGGSYTYAVSSGTLPAGLNLNPSTGFLSGVPSANGSFTFTITATGWGGCTGGRSYTVTISGGGGCPTITLPASAPNGSVGQLYLKSVAASPAGFYNYTASGSLPPGVTLFNSIGLIFGFPTAAGSYTFTITATAGACSGSQTYTVMIGAGFASSLTVFSDFDGDGKSDLSVFRGGDGAWLVANSGDGQWQSTAWGSSAAPYNDVTVSGDYDGDGKTDLAVFRRGGEYAGYWFIKRSSDGEVSSHFWGLPTDIPVPGDYDADGKTDVAVWRGSAGAWYIRRSSDGGVDAINWGYAPIGDLPVPGDYDGDSKTDVAVFRKSTGFWYIHRSSDGVIISAKWGISTDVPVPGDYDGDNKTDIAVWRGSEGNWYIVESGSAMTRTMWSGVASEGDVPVTADYDGDGKADAAIWRASTGTWTIRRSSDDAEVTKTHGQSGDVPIMARRN